MSDDLVAFIEARLAEDELWALAASAPDSWRGDYPPIPTGVRWTWALGDNWEPYEIDPLEEHIGESADEALTLVTVDEWPYPEPRYGHATFRHDVISNAEEVRTVDGAHIARHDPSRVLRRVATDRRLIETYREAQVWYTANPSAPAGEVQGLWTAVQLLAGVWSEHPDFRSEWSLTDG